MMTIVSGGQTGVDRAALDAAIEMGIHYRGWCPKGHWAEDQPQSPDVLARYQNLRETPAADPLQRTEWNVRDSDRLLVLIDYAGLSVSTGTEAAIRAASRLGKPHIVINLDAEDPVAKALAWLEPKSVDIAICIAGPRESEAPGIYFRATVFLKALFSRVP
jgi:Circularly permutated YpsA SLOG family